MNGQTKAFRAPPSEVGDITADSSCRQLRCSRELPRCDRCLRLGAVCEFPAPPDRKVLAASRAQSRKRKLETDNVEAPAERIQREAPTSVPSTHSLYPSNDAATVDAGMYPSLDQRLSTPVQTLLQDVYFTCMFNSTLVFHRPTFSRAFQDQRVPRHVLLAMYASATM